MSKPGALRTTATWAESLQDLKEEFRKWDKADYVLPTINESKALGKVRVTFAVNGVWTPLECSLRAQPYSPFSPETSIRAILIAIEGARKADQRGIGALLAAATQHLALPPKQAPEQVLGLALGERDSLKLRQAYVARAKATHPDTGGDEAEFKKVQQAAEELGVV